MFTSFDERVFRQAIEDKDFRTLKVNTVSTMLTDPTFRNGETKKVLDILENEVPEIFEEYIMLDYEEELDRDAWDERYFTKMAFWFQDNFAKKRIDRIEEVGQTVYAVKNIAKEPVETKQSYYYQEQKGNFQIARAIMAGIALALAIILLIKSLAK